MEKKINQSCQFRITVDQGGTFADGVLVDDKHEISVTKAITNPDDPAQSIMDCITLLANEYVSIKAAKELYGVIIDPDSFEVDQPATAALRKKMKKADKT